MKDFFVCFCKDCKVNCNTHYKKLMNEMLTGNVFCYHTWSNKISKRKVNGIEKHNQKN